jgi:Zn-dependent peptidase ImmA (M78 family)/transcriptional regulator with XRE-family HTH domain
MSDQANPVGERLVFGRTRAGLTQAAVRERTGIGESSLSDFENGKREASLSQLTQLADAYRLPIAFFLSSEPLPKEAVLWRKRPEQGAEEIETRFLRLCEQYHNLETWCGSHAQTELPVARRPKEPFDRSDAEVLATDVRQKLALGDYPALGLIESLEEQCGLKVFHLDFEPSGTDACTNHPTYGPAVLLNQKNPHWRRNFDLAHELFHLLTWSLLRPASKGTVTCWESEEKLADAFAANLLMPADAVRAAVNARRHGGKLSVPDVFEIARQFDVSIEALVWRIHAVFGGTQESKHKTEEMLRKARASVWAVGEREREAAPTRPARFLALAVTALRRGEISVGRFAEYVGMSRQEAMRYAEQEPDGDEEIELPAA